MTDNAQLNCYGDHAKQKMGSFGYDISSQRLDDLDKSFIKFILDYV